MWSGFPFSALPCRTFVSATKLSHEIAMTSRCFPLEAELLFAKPEYLSDEPGSEERPLFASSRGRIFRLFDLTDRVLSAERVSANHGYKGKLVDEDGCIPGDAGRIHSSEIERLRQRLCGADKPDALAEKIFADCPCPMFDWRF
ncbi:hypothetical protein LshimejAT787_1700490 [Lyophyllum shimeji]|uniref:Uncharacterized protein n=1 Tax=Lyophyllum shimeji TaxID=47721 RepID=A0A9P3PWS8_LYOSH|nr:hypothetical protein LshimejAT787_1700490 [Lyophyllum shimeji]